MLNNILPAYIIVQKLFKCNTRDINIQKTPIYKGVFLQTASDITPLELLESGIFLLLTIIWFHHYDAANSYSRHHIWER